MDPHFKGKLEYGEADAWDRLEKAAIDGVRAQVCMYAHVKVSLRKNIAGFWYNGCLSTACSGGLLSY